MAIKKSTEKALLDAMERLFAGTPIRTDGNLNVSGLAAEANVSRSTTNRAHAILVQFRNRLTQATETEERTPSFRERICELENEVKTLKKEERELIATLRASVNILAQQVQALTIENIMLREELNKSQDNVSNLHRSR